MVIVTIGSLVPVEQIIIYVEIFKPPGERRYPSRELDYRGYYDQEKLHKILRGIRGVSGGSKMVEINRSPSQNPLGSKPANPFMPRRILCSFMFSRR